MFTVLEIIWWWGILFFFVIFWMFRFFRVFWMFLNNFNIFFFFLAFLPLERRFSNVTRIFFFFCLLMRWFWEIVLAVFFLWAWGFFKTRWRFFYFFMVFIVRLSKEISLMCVRFIFSLFFNCQERFVFVTTFAWISKTVSKFFGSTWHKQARSLALRSAWWPVNSWIEAVASFSVASIKYFSGWVESESETLLTAVKVTVFFNAVDAVLRISSPRVFLKLSVVVFLHSLL